MKTYVSRLKCSLGELKDWIPNSWKKVVISFGLAVVMGFTGAVSGCSTTQSTLPSPTITQTTSAPSLTSIITPTSIGTQTPTSSPTPTSTPVLYTVTNSTFFDYNGDGDQDNGEPSLGGIELEYQPGDYKCITDKDGKGVVSIPAGSYELYVSGNASKKFRYFLPSVSEVSKIGDGLNESITGNMTISIPLGEGYLTLPFPTGTIETQPRVYVDVDLTKGIMKDWNGGKQTYDNHLGTDFIIPSGTPILAAAPGIVVESLYDQDDGNRIAIKHRDGNLTIYCHLETRIVQTGEMVSRGEEIGVSDNTGNLAGPNPHLHFQFGDYGIKRVDPYRDATNPLSMNWWTVDNDPQYPDVFTVSTLLPPTALSCWLNNVVQYHIYSFCEINFECEEDFSLLSACRHRDVCAMVKSTEVKFFFNFKNLY